MVSRRRSHWTLGRRSVQFAAVTLLAGAAILGITNSPAVGNERGSQSDESTPGSDRVAVLPPQERPPGGATNAIAPAPLKRAASPKAPKVNASKILGFIHIPLNGGGAIEELSEKEGLGWISPESQSWPWQGEPVILGEGYPCSRRQVPPSVLGPQVARESFCIVRDPYERMVEEFKRVASDRPKIFTTFDECFEALNTFVHDSLKWLLGDQTRPRQPYASNCQFLPQAAYVHSWNPRSMQVDGQQRSCSTVLKYETLRADANQLFEARGYSHRLQDTRPPVPKACPMIDRMCLSPHSRGLIEKAFETDFRLLHFAKVTFVEFIHIPRSGGSAIEDAGKYFYGWGSLNTRIQGAKTIGTGTCQGQHTPPSHLQDVFTDVETFCIVRDVYNKMTSQFRLLVVDTNDGQVHYQCSTKDLNRFVHDYLAGKNRYGYPYGSDCHFLPQGAYVYSWDSEHVKVDTSKRWCRHVIPYERLHDGVNSLWKSKGYPMRLKKQTFGAAGRGCSLKASDLTEESMTLINKTYKEDLLLLERLRTEQPTWPTESMGPPAAASLYAGSQQQNAKKAKNPPKERMLLLAEQEVRRGTLIADDLKTGEDFEISFDITPRGTVGSSGISNILRVTSTSQNYGHQGDRMPEFSFWARSTKLLAYMGNPMNHNADCSTDPLPVGTPSRVVARLQGTTFTVTVDGQKGCTIDNYEEKYKAMQGVKVWIGDRWDEPADALIGNIVYRAGPLQPQASQKRELVFIAIPLNGEQVIEELSEQGPSGWGSQNSHLAGRTTEFSQGYPCKMSSVPPSLVPWVYAHRETFCIVRDPYDRMISEFRRSAEESGTQKPEECEAGLNAFLNSHLQRVLGDARNAARPFAADCRFLPQAAYVYSWHAKSERVDTRQRRCSHVLRFERLVQEASTLLGSSGYSRHPVQLPAEAAACPSLEKASLNKTSRALIDLAFREDFRLLGFTRMGGKPPVVRTLLIDKRNVQEGGNIVNNLLTASDFELSFELTPLKPAQEHGGSGSAVLGIGDVLACELLPGTSRLQCSAGLEADADGHCATPDPGLPLGEASQVAVRGFVSMLELHVNGTLACRARALRAAPSTGTSFWIGGKVQKAAAAVVASVHYKVKAEPEAAAWGAPRLVTSRTLVGGTQSCKRNKLILDNIATFEEFELSFDVQANSKPGIEGMLNNLFLMTTTDNHYGHPGDRMPALFFVGGSTKLIGYMGHANDHNADCPAGHSGLPAGKKSRVTLRLVGAVFRLFVDGKEVCSKDGYTARYSPVRNARLYISDRFSEPANAKISNMVYKVAGWNEDVDVWAPLTVEEEEEAAPLRLLLRGPARVERGLLILQDLVSSQDFEVSFDIWVVDLVSFIATVMLFTSTDGHYGHTGDRMPAFLLLGGTSRLIAHMGQPKDHNGLCTMTAPGLTLNRTAHVSAQLKGTDFTLRVNGKVECSIGGFASKYPSMQNVKLWVGDKFNEAANAFVSNITYVALQ